MADSAPSSLVPQGQPGAHSGLDPVSLLESRFIEAIARIAPDAHNAEALITPSKRPELGDFQSNAAMPLAKVLGRPPREIAAELVRTLDLSQLAEPIAPTDIAGPGFINIRLSGVALGALLQRLDTPELGLDAPTTPMTIVVDVCGVNLAKQMHVGHLRATVIGDTLARLFERLGHTAIRQNHVGDWGLPIAMVTAKLRQEAAANRLDLSTLDLDTLDRLYKVAQAECKGQKTAIAVATKYNMGPKILAELGAEQEEADEHMLHAKETLIKLQGGDGPTVAIWQRIYDTTMAACLDACQRLCTHITNEHSAGESSYREELAPLVADLQRRGIAEESSGALVVRVDDAGIAEPCLVRKSDGGYLYATTDLAAIRRRVQTLGADRVVYCVDARQSLHFRQVFAAATKAGYTTREGAEHPAPLEHAAFGMVMGEDGRPFKTRSGENVRLSALLDEAVGEATRVVKEKNPELNNADVAKIAEAVGIAAIKHTDLCNDRMNDYVFSFERMLAFEGNTGPYLLYALARVRSIFRKAEERGLGTAHTSAEFLITEPAEKALALTLLRYPQTVRSAADTLHPHRLCGLLFDLATAFSAFFVQCRVLDAQDESVRQSRLRLCDLTGRVLADGLATLGIPVLDRM